MCFRTNLPSVWKRSVDGWRQDCWLCIRINNHWSVSLRFSPPDKAKRWKVMWEEVKLGTFTASSQVSVKVFSGSFNLFKHLQTHRRNTYCQNGVVPRPEIPVGCHHAGQRVDLKPLVTAVLQLVRHHGVQALVIITSDHPADFLFTAALALFQQLDVEKFICELRPVVVGVQNLNHDGGGGSQRRRAVIRHDYLAVKERRTR